MTFSRAQIARMRRAAETLEWRPLHARFGRALLGVLAAAWEHSVLMALAVYCTFALWVR